VPVVATGSFGLTIEDKVDFTKRIYNTGVNAVILITGHYANVDDGDDVWMANFNKMLRLTDNIPLGLYECPAPYKRILSPEVFKNVIETNRIVYYKDTSIAQDKVKAKLDIVKSVKSKRFEFYDAHSPNAMTSLREGAKGMSSIAGNFYPEILVWMCNHATDPSKSAEVEWLQAEIAKADVPVHLAYPMSAKYFLRKRGLPIRTISRAHALELTLDQKKGLDQLHETFMGWCDRLGIKPVNPVETASLSQAYPDPAI
jgi:4-hydroxy-tetrahydrodipicolinate synthase